ncbi:MAG TPA: AAA family ATPase [Allosphingosinicella sp.]|uniref:AAA family ATPase n=1 Tax=Allosphingosinicella sp. TaxID=2823234 RepID=UPI002ED99714
MDEQSEPSLSSEADAVRLEAFSIVGLHKAQTVQLIFAPDHSIFIADNGAGKTTALFVLQSILADNWKGILRYHFDKIILQFSSGDTFSVPRRDIADQPSLGLFRRLAGEGLLTEGEIAYLARRSRHTSLSELRNDALFQQIYRRSRMPTSKLYELLVRYASYYDDDVPLLGSGIDSDLSRLRAFLKAAFRHSVIYLPTYRRVEQELRMLIEKADNEDVFADAIRFGMKDVEKRIEALGKRIRDHLAVTYGKVSGEMLHQLARSTDLSKEMQRVLGNRDDIAAVLTRLSDYVSAEDRDHILSLCDDGLLIENQHLAFFLYNLIAAYEEIRHLERSLQSFGAKCNQYLIRKEFRYDAATASLKLFHRASEAEPLSLNALSSGEKQIVGVLSQVYLGKEASYVVIFDEPELSLSVEWQRKILPDIIASDKCFSLIAATHSPFIFDNDLDSRARSLTNLEYSSEPEANDGFKS